jgi:organic hydroperoxide reductase OsmC/OhrA
MEKGADGRIQMTRVTLKPRVIFSGDKRPNEEDVEALHHKAQDACYIANTVKSEIVVEGEAEGLA